MAQVKKITLTMATIATIVRKKMLNPIGDPQPYHFIASWPYCNPCNRSICSTLSLFTQITNFLLRVKVEGEGGQDLLFAFTFNL